MSTEDFEVGDRVRAGFSSGYIAAFRQRRWGRVALVYVDRECRHDGTAPHEVPVSSLRKEIA
ncbi:hypothetical protein [Micromonospora sediminicola]|uniref:hypothetical protein n=1 Tax=Micromonospora sediminicola TaxID=946078 RepID=UPI0037A43D73